ncbi:MAG: radical SAM protein, partial [Bdellovibrionales bacterium]|nr:radical SAM protein [Oligoflexia bacterium]
DSHPAVHFFREAHEDYEKTIDSVVRFLQGKDPVLAHRIATRTLLPEGPRFQNLDQEDLGWAFGLMGTHDQAKHIASLYIDDLADVITHGIDSKFSLSRYGEKLAASQPTFTPLQAALNEESSLIDGLLEKLVVEVLELHEPEVLLLTVPFPGCLLGALKIAKVVKKKRPAVRIALGGGYVNTELRKLKDARIFDYVDALTLDDGERPITLLLEYWEAKRTRAELYRTFLRSDKVSTAVEYCSSIEEHDLPQTATGFPTLEGLPMGSYLSMVEMLNPMHRFWSDLHWNKLMLAHGCYWHQCSFCDVSLDYIKRYEISPTDLTIERMKRLEKEAGSSGFHFVDEAAPPAVLKDLSKKLIEQKLSFSWWGNIRFEKTFTPELTELMSDAGCVAVSGGLEVASDRLLKKMKKGVTVEQVARVTKNFRNAKVLVHAYLMYGFPSQTVQETVDSLERVRQLFKAGCLSSAFWHRFSATAHSPVGLNPEEYSVQVFRDPGLSFAENDLAFEDPTGVDHTSLGAGLKKAVYNFMLGIGLDYDVRDWFDFKVPKPQVDPLLIEKALR